MLTLQTLLDKMHQMSREPDELELSRNEFRILVARVAELDDDDGEEDEEDE